MTASTPGLLLAAACLLASSRCVSSSESPAAAPPPPAGPAPWEASPSTASVLQDPAKPVLNELVSGPDLAPPGLIADPLVPRAAVKDNSTASRAEKSVPAVPKASQQEHDDNLVRGLEPHQAGAPEPVGPPDGQLVTTQTPVAPDDVDSTIGPPNKRRPIKKANLTLEDRGERLGRLVSAEQEANALAARPRRFPGGDSRGEEDGPMEGADVTKRPRVRISVRRSRLNATSVPPPEPVLAPAPAPEPTRPAPAVPPTELTPTKQAAWRPIAVESNVLTTDRAPPATATREDATVLPDKPANPNSIQPRREGGDRDESMELSSVSPLQRSRLSTLRWKHSDRPETTTEAMRRVRHRETPATTPSRPLVRRGSVRFGAQPSSPPPRLQSPPPPPVPAPVATPAPLAIIEVSTLPDMATSFAVMPEVVMNEDTPMKSDLMEKKASMMLEMNPHLPLEKVFSTSPSPGNPALPEAPDPIPATKSNKTSENLVKFVLEPEDAEPAGPPNTFPTKIAAVHTTSRGGPVSVEEEVRTNAPNIHIVDPPNLVTAPGRHASSSAAPSTTSVATTTATSPETKSEPNRWRPVQSTLSVQTVRPSRPPQPAYSLSTTVDDLTTTTNGAPVSSFTYSPNQPASSSESTFVEYQTFPPGYITAHSAPSVPSESDSYPKQDEELVSTRIPLDGKLETAGGPTTPIGDDDDEDREEDMNPIIVPATSVRSSSTTSFPVTEREEEDAIDMFTSPPSPSPPPHSTPSVLTTTLSTTLSSTPVTSPAPTSAQELPSSSVPIITSTSSTTVSSTLSSTVPSTTPTTVFTTVSTTASPIVQSSAGTTEATPVTSAGTQRTTSEAAPETTLAETTTSSPTSPSAPSPGPSIISSSTNIPRLETSSEKSSTPIPSPAPELEASVEHPSAGGTEDELETSTVSEEPSSEPNAEDVDEQVPVQEQVPAYLRLLMEMTWRQFCSEADAFKSAVAALISNGTFVPIHSSQVVLLQPNSARCAEEARGEDAITTEAPELGDARKMISVQMFIADNGLRFSKNLTEDFLRFWGCRGMEYPIRKVDLVLQQLVGADGGGQGSGAGVIAAIAISCVAAACLLLLAALLLIMRKRQKSLSYGQRCTPVSLDAYSLDSVSVCNSSSVRRKGARASKRSYGNPAFSDPAAPSHPLTFAALSNMSSDRAAMEAEFTAIPQVAPKADELPNGADTKNRYANVIPLPETRVMLSCRDGDPLTQYINANYVRGPKSTDKFYIACQAPLTSTVEDFWRMVWETQAKVILMLTDLVEDGVEKCADYLPPSEVTDCHRLFGDFQVTMKKREVKDKYVVSSLQLKNMETNLWREATHLWYVGWPSRGVPDDPSTIIAFLIEARAFMRSPSASSTATTAPHIVHCSPGTGRTGTVLAIDLCVREFETTRQVDIPRTVYRLRKDRAGCVQTKEQYVFIYKVLNLYATKLTGGGLDSI